MVVSKLEFNVNGLSVSYCRSVARINQSDAVFFFILTTLFLYENPLWCGFIARQARSQHFF